MKKKELKEELESELFERVFGPEKEEFWMELARKHSQTGRRERQEGESQEDWDKYLSVAKYLESIIKHDNLTGKIKI